MPNEVLAGTWESTVAVKVLIYTRTDMNMNIFRLGPA